MRTPALLFVSVLLCIICAFINAAAWKIDRKIFDGLNIKIATAVVSSAAFLGPQPSNAFDSVNFQNFIELLDSNAVEKVVFKGINPKYIVITLKDGGKVAEVREGFPFYDDPLSPSGPTQVLAKVKSVPSVKWEYDLSELQTIRESKGRWPYDN